MRIDIVRDIFMMVMAVTGIIYLFTAGLPIWIEIIAVLFVATTALLIMQWLLADINLFRKGASTILEKGDE